jgi:flagellar biosynthesis/type III secretory pathway protein FliH
MTDHDRLFKKRVMELTTSWKEEGIAIGRKQGLEQGLQQGRAEGSRETLLWQLNRRLGRLAPALQRRVENLPTDEVRALAEAIFDFSTPRDLQKWLAAR